MASKSRYFSAYPTINQGYLSGGTGRDKKSYTFEDIVSPTKDSSTTNVIIQPNINHNVFSKINSASVEELTPIQTQNFNVIRVSVDTNYFGFNNISDELFIDVLQGHSPDNMAVSYTTPIETMSTFFRSYPVKNNFCNIQFRNETSSNIHLDCDVTLSKFSQFNPPSQLGDLVDFKEMTNLSRLANEYYDDVSRNLYENADINNSNGFFKNNITQTQIIAPVTILENTANVYTEVFGVSDSALDGFEMVVSGQTDIVPSGRIKNGIQITGTTNGTASINRYKYIDTIELPQINTGNITIQKNGTSDIVAFIPADNGSLSSPITYINKIEEGVLKEVRVAGLTSIQNGSIEVRLNQGNNTKTIWQTGVLDGDIRNVWQPDYKLPSDSTVYAIVRDVDTTTHLGQRLDVSLKVLKYKIKPVGSLSS